MPRKRDRPVRGLEQSGQTREQGGLAAAARTEEDDQFAVLGVQAQAVERAHTVATRVELHGQVTHFELTHGPSPQPANALAGSAATARRSAIRLDSSPTTTADTGSTMYALTGKSTGWEKTPTMNWASTAAKAAAMSATSTAWKASPT